MSTWSIRPPPSAAPSKGVDVIGTRRFSGLAAVLFLIGLFLGLPTSPAQAIPSHYKFDFGNQAVERSYIGLSAGDRYDASKRYGFNTPENMRDLPASASGVTSDAV